MLKYIITAAAFAVLAAPTASAHNVHKTRTVVKKAKPSLTRHARAVSRVSVVKVSPFVSVAIPRLAVSVPVVKVVPTPRRALTTRVLTSRARSRRVIRR